MNLSPCALEGESVLVPQRDRVRRPDGERGGLVENQPRWLETHADDGDRLGRPWQF